MWAKLCSLFFRYYGSPERDAFGAFFYAFGDPAGGFVPAVPVGGLWRKKWVEGSLMFQTSPATSFSTNRRAFN